MIDDMVTLLKAEQSEDDSREEYCIKGFDETRGRGQRSSHKDAVKSSKDQLSNTDGRVEALKNSTDVRDSSVSWTRRVSGIVTRGSKCYLRVGHHHTYRMARPRVCVGDNSLLSQKMHYYHSARDACDHRVNTTTCTTHLTQTLDTALSWRSDASSSWMVYHPAEQRHDHSHTTPRPPQRND